jgi:hypothetical protein
VIDEKMRISGTDIAHRLELSALVRVLERAEEYANSEMVRQQAVVRQLWNNPDAQEMATNDLDRIEQHLADLRRTIAAAKRFGALPS